MKLTHPYCEYVSNIIDKNDVDKIYHDNHYGRRIEDDNELFCRLVMEINQAGLSWRTILKKERGFRKAYHNFTIRKVAKYGTKDFERLMNDNEIIRNKLKIKASIYNARKILELQKEYGSFRKWLDIQFNIILVKVSISQILMRKDGGSRAEAGAACFYSNKKHVAGIQNLDSRFHGNDIKKEWTKLSKKHFKFMGSEIVSEFLMSINMLEGSHDKNCKTISQQ